MSNYYIWLALFAFVGYYVATDEAVAEQFYVFFLGVWVQLRKYYYMVTMHPFWFMNPVGKWWMMRKYRKIAREIMKEQGIKDEEA
ncbi:hypothetical protein [Synechococcus phage MA10]|uniref:Uncharacterized protein n=1 Tax=Synechococcus phage S-H34 TaxID=2718942 RepID=A0A6G8R6I4_9CAUD|nr:hypothetical protein PQC15_gp136 [Synechococcus phage S-H34]QIN97007.1 hypothetical protein [Synechococcus phage S-H34]